MEKRWMIRLLIIGGLLALLFFVPALVLYYLVR